MSGNRYTEAEDAILRANWGTLGRKVLALLPNRSYASVCDRARILGVNRKQWPQEEEELLRALWPTMGVKCLSNFPRRTKRGITAKAEVMGLRRARKKPKAIGAIPKSATSPRSRRSCYGHIPTGAASSIWHLAAITSGEQA